MRCTEATLKAFNIHGICPTYGSGVVQALQNNGYRIDPIIEACDITLGQFRKLYPTGMYVVSTSEHSMALIDNVLTDTANGTDRRKVKYALKVYR